MKITSYLSIAALALAFVSCDDDFNDYGGQAINSQPEILALGNGGVSAVDPILLAEMPEGDSIKVCQITPPTSNLDPTGENNTYELNLGQAVFPIDRWGQMLKTDLVSYVEGTYGKKPVARQMSATLTAYSGSADSRVKIVSQPFYIIATPDAPFIDKAYYIVGSIDGWKCQRVEDYKMTNGGGDPYSDPVFTALLPNPGEGTVEIKIIPESAFAEDGNIANWGIALSALPGATGTANTGSFSYNNAGGNIAFAADAQTKLYSISVNLMEGTYTIKPVNFTPFIYEIGNESSWSTGNPLASPALDGNYRGFAWLDGEFKYKPNADNWDDDYEKASGDCYEGTLRQDGGPNIDAIPAGFYMMDVDVKAMTYKHTAIATIGLIGSATAGGWDSSTPMEWDAAAKCWTITTMLTDGEFKFRANDDWAINWGGEPTNLTMDGANIPATAGTYTIRLYAICQGKSYCEIVAQ